MEWWYKSTKYDYSAQSIVMLQNELEKELILKNAMRTANLYDDNRNFFISTSNNIILHSFLFKHGFEEIYDTEGLSSQELDLLWEHT